MAREDIRTRVENILQIDYGRKKKNSDGGQKGQSLETIIGMSKKILSKLKEKSEGQKKEQELTNKR